MGRYFGKKGTSKDANHDLIYDAIAALGWSVRDFSDCPNKGFDMQAFKTNGKDPYITYYIEIKDGDKIPSKRKLTESEKAASIFYKPCWIKIETISDVFEFNRKYG